MIPILSQYGQTIFFCDHCISIGQLLSITVLIFGGTLEDVDHLIDQEDKTCAILQHQQVWSQYWNLF